MSNRTNAEVVIGGRIYTISGYETEEYFQIIAGYINGKAAEFNKNDSYKKLPADYQAVLMQVNIADDYFRARKQIELLEEEVKEKEKEVYDLKHEIISFQIKQDNLEKTVKSMEAKIREYEKEIVRLQTELKNLQ